MRASGPQVALRWFCSRSLLRHEGITKELIDRIPGKQTDRKTPLGELRGVTGSNGLAAFLGCGPQDSPGTEGGVGRQCYWEGGATDAADRVAAVPLPRRRTSGKLLCGAADACTLAVG